MCVSHSVMPNSATPWAVAHQAPLSMEFSRQEYWSGLPFPLEDLPDPGIEPASPALAGGFFTTEPPGKAAHTHTYINICVCVCVYGYIYTHAHTLQAK